MLKDSLEDKSKKGRILSLDIGDKRIGMAVSDPFGIIAQGIPTLSRKGIKHDVKYITQVIVQWGIDKVIYGLPRNMNGTLGPQADKTEQFIEKLKFHSDCPFITWDERLTSEYANKILKEAGLSRKKRAKKVDSLAAVLILQSYLDQCQRSEQNGD